jgi:asparaginyl-tRNA synthetase
MEIVKETKVSNDKKILSHTLNQLNNSSSLEKLYNTAIRFYGWIRRVRVGGGGTMVFIDIYDGSDIGVFMCVASSNKYYTNGDNKYEVLSFDDLSDASKLSPGCAVVVDGILVKSPDKTTQKFEHQVYKLQVIGNVEDYQTYPIQKSSEKNFLSLRQMPFMRMKSQLVQSLFRIRSSLLFVIHSFFHEKGIICTDPNIITSSDCEGAGEVFKLSPQIFGKDYSVGLTVSSQLPLEALATGLKEVYTCQKSFRAEKSDTSKHLAEFLHIEYEGYFITLDKLLTFTEEFVKFCIKETLRIRSPDFDFLESKFSPSELHGTREMLLNILEKDFIKIKHRDAVDLIRKLVQEKAKLPDDSGKLKRVKVKEWPEYDGDLSSEHEKILVKYYDGFVFVTHWPLKIKSFYMKQCDDESGECESFDLLAPSVGEMFGGSMREWRFDKLDSEIKKRHMDISPIQWYLDLRKSGSAPHGGWGLGFDRMLMLITGVPSVRDVVPFPVYYEHCPY